MKEGGGKSIHVPWPEGQELEISSALQERHQVPCQQIQLLPCSSSLRPWLRTHWGWAHRSHPCAELQRQCCFHHPPPRPCIPRWNRCHSMTAWTPTLDASLPSSIGAWGLSPAWASLNSLRALATRPQGPGHARQPQPLKVRLFPQHRQRGPETMLSPCPALCFLWWNMWQQNPGWNGTEGRRWGEETLMVKT